MLIRANIVKNTRTNKYTIFDSLFYLQFSSYSLSDISFSLSVPHFIQGMRAQFVLCGTNAICGKTG